jgi:lipopolysaccharide/colanic/teichoic acid biosynthesis glycosyltransferase
MTTLVSLPGAQDRGAQNPGAEDNVSRFWESYRPRLAYSATSADRYARSGRYAPRVSGASLSANKRLFDFTGALAGLLFLLPLFVAIAVAIKVTSRGPVFFRQYRYGYRNRLFRIYKFRTMYTALGDSSGRRQTVARDARVTRIGRILRNTSLDEIPQLINVLRGEMSLVGPRPHVPGMLAAGVLYEDLVPYYFQRHAVRPGITGLAQVNGCRGSTEEGESAIARVDYDLDYIEHRSLRLDLSIIVRTVRKEFLAGSGM